MKEKLKDIFNRLFNPNYITPEYKLFRIKYLGQFKKEYDDMTTAEKIMSMSLYSIELKHHDTLRHLGALEATFIMLGVLEPGNSIKYGEGENYKSYMIRITKEYLTKSGCYEENKTN